jgi:primosomal replication protein N''
VLLWPVRVNLEVGNRGHVTIGFGRDHDADRDPDFVFLNPAFEGILGIETARQWLEAVNDLLTRASITAAGVMDALGMFATPKTHLLALALART